MSSLFGRFVLYNLLPSLGAGVIAWLLLQGALYAFRIRYAPLRLSLLYAPLLKSTLVLLGVGLLFPWPRPFFAALHARALPPGQALPIFTLWAGLALLGGLAATALARRRLKELAQGEGDQPRASRSLERVMSAYRSQPCCQVGEGWASCSMPGCLPQPRLLLSPNLDSPLVLHSDPQPLLVFPRELALSLSDGELDGALAHEVAHLSLKRPLWCSWRAIAWLGALSPAAGLLAAQMRREEEKACDDLVVALLGHAESYAQMLLKSYRFARQQAGGLSPARWQGVSWLLGFKPALAERVERLLQPSAPAQDIWLQRCAACLLWLGVVVIL